MSHSKERQEKICLNCKAELNGRFCHICGQENVDPKESAWSLVSHFIYDITHFDGKFFSTVKYLVRKPGFLPKEYIRGRRASYLHPIRMYVFSSAIFFTIFFWLFSANNIGLGYDDNSLTMKNVASDNRGDSIEAVHDSATLKEKQQALKNAKTIYDSIKIEAYYGAMEAQKKDKKANSQDSIATDLNKEQNVVFGFVEGYKTVAQYDSLQKTLPQKKRDGWLERAITHRSIQLNDRYKDRPGQFLREVVDKFIHTFPYLLFVSLPLYALFLKLLYVRRKQFYYVDHGIFLVYLYIFTFLVLLVLFSLNELQKTWHTSWIWLLQTALFIYGIVYTLKAMRNFYEQSRGRTILKFILLNILAFISLTILFLLFLALTFFRV